MSQQPEKPSYRSTRRILWTSFVLSWLVIFMSGIAAALGSEQAVAFGAVAVPSMVGLIIGVLTVHRGFGSVDFRARPFEQPQDRRNDPHDRFSG